MLAANHLRAQGIIPAALLSMCLLQNVPSVALAQQTPANAVVKYDSVPLKDEYKPGSKGYKELENAKKEALKGQFDVKAIQDYYVNFLIPLLTAEEPNLVNAAVRSIRDDMQVALKLPPENLKKYNDLLFSYLTRLLTKNYRPTAVVNSVLLIGELSQEKGSPEKPYAPALSFLIGAAEKGANDGIKSAALVGLERHIRISGSTWSDQQRDALAGKLISLAKSSRPPSQSASSHAYIAARYLQLMDLFKHTKGSEAVAFATDTLANEYTHPILREQALHILGVYAPIDQPAEKTIAAGRYTLRYMKRRLEDWRELYQLSATASAVASIYGGGEGRPSSGMSSMDSLSRMPGGESGNSYGMNAQTEERNKLREDPFKKQDAQTVVLRRFMHELMQRLRFGLSGEKSGAVGIEFKKGLLARVPEGEEQQMLLRALTAMKDMQEALNDEKIQTKTDMVATVLPLVDTLIAAAESYPGAIDLENERIIEEATDTAPPPEGAEMAEAATEGVDESVSVKPDSANSPESE